MCSAPKSCYEGYDRRWAHTRRAHQAAPLDDLFQTFKNLAIDDDMLLFARWYDSLLHALSPAGGNRRHLFMAAYYFARQALVTDHRQSTGSGRVQ
jgi:hypothetical protein